MVEVLKALVMGIVQGLTEFLPVSSSGHLEIARVLLQDESTAEVGLLMSVVLHFGTALATVLVFRKDIAYLVNKMVSGDRESLNYSFMIIVSMIPAVFVGLFFDELLEQMFDKNLLLVGCMLLVTATLLWFSDTYYQSDGKLNVRKAFIIGLAQAFAILPGVSRSGATISMSLFLSISREEAARFSFLMVVPLIFGKIAKDLISGSILNSSIEFPILVIGFFSAFLSGALACMWMVRIVQAARLRYFAMYCVIVGTIAILTQTVWI